MSDPKLYDIGINGADIARWSPGHAAGCRTLSLITPQAAGERGRHRRNAAINPCDHGAST